MNDVVFLLYDIGQGRTKAKVALMDKIVFVVTKF